MSNLLLVFIISLLGLPHLELPRTFNMVTAIIFIALAWILVVFGGRIDLT
jgi:hypothetical protein